MIKTNQKNNRENPHIEYINRFLKAWAVGLPIAIGTALLVGPLAKKFVDRITK